MNAVFGKTMENVKNIEVLKLVTTERRRNYLVSEPNYHTTKFFTENLLAIEMRKTQILLNTPVYLGSSIIDLSNTIMHEFFQAPRNNPEYSLSVPSPLQSSRHPGNILKEKIF